MDLDTETGEITPVLDRIIHYPPSWISVDSWIFTSGHMDRSEVIDINLKTATTELNEAMDQIWNALAYEHVCSYNNSFDISRFLYPMDICIFEVAPDPMILSTKYGEWNSWNGYARLESIYNEFFPDKARSESHRACSDAVQCAEVIWKMICDGNYPLDNIRFS